MVTISSSPFRHTAHQAVDTPRLSSSKSLWTHFVDRINSVEGMFDALKVGDYASQWLKMIPHFSSKKTQLSSAQGVFFAGATLASLPGLVTTIGDTVQSCSLFGRAVIDKTRNPTEREREITSTAKKSARNLLDLACMGADTANNFHDLGWVDLGKAAPVSSGIFCGTDLVSNGLDLAREVGKVTERSTERRTKQISPERNTAIHHKDNLSYIRIFKNTVCIIGSAIGLAALVMGGSVVLPVVGLAISSMWIVSKIIAHFYKEIAVKSSSLAYKTKI